MVLIPLRPALRPLRLAASRRAFSATPRTNNVARVTLVGHLGADAEAVTTQNGTELLKYAIATSSGPINNRNTSWWRIQSFDSRPEAKERMLGQLKKGTQVFVEGNAQMRKYEGEDGKEHQALSITQVSYRVLRNAAIKGEEAAMEEEQ